MNFYFQITRRDKVKKARKRYNKPLIVIIKNKKKKMNIEKNKPTDLEYASKYIAMRQALEDDQIADVLEKEYEYDGSYECAYDDYVRKERKHLN